MVTTLFKQHWLGNQSGRSVGLKALLAGSALLLDASSIAAAQDNLPLQNAPPIHLGDSEARVRSVFRTKAPLYQAPFASARSTTKVDDGIFVDFMKGKVVEVDVASKSSDIRIGDTTIGSTLAAAKQNLGLPSTPSTPSTGGIRYTASGGEIVELRFVGAEPRLLVFALIGDRTHAPIAKTIGRVILRNSGLHAAIRP